MNTRIRFRAVILGLVIGLVLCGLAPFNNAYLRSTPLAGGHFPLAPFFVLIWLTIGLAATARILKRPPFLNGLELITGWVIMVVMSGIGFTGLVRTFFINLTAPMRFAGPSNRWDPVLTPLLPEAWFPQSSQAVELLYNGLEQGRNLSLTEIATRIPWQAWIGPLLTWTVFILLAYMVMFCLTTLFSRQWVVNERVNFPLLRVPQLMLEAFDQQRLGAFLSDRYLLTGMGMVIFLHLLNGLSAHYPSVPQLPTLILAGSYFPETGLFSGFHKLKMYVYPAFIGFAFLTTRQISFSFWVFFLLGGLLFGLLGTFGLQIPDAALGVTFGPTMARPEEAQMIGAFFIFFLFLIWLARFHLRDTAGQLFLPWRFPSPSSDVEWFPARYGLLGALLGLGGLVGWSTLFGMGMLPGLTLFLTFFMVLLVATRIVCQGGIPYFTLTAAPTDGILALFGSRFFSATGLLMAAVMQKVLFVDLRESLMPSLMHAAKTGERGSNRGWIGIGIAVALISAVAVSFISMLVLCHKYGIRELDLDWATRTTLNVYGNAQRLIEIPSETRHWVVVFGTVGAVVMLVLTLCYNRFYWWPLHPLGYLMAYSSAMRILWFSFFLGWLCNTLCLRYGGTQLFRRVRLLFIGFIIGDFLMGGGWAVIGLLTGISYQVLPS